MNQSLKLPMLGCDDASSVTDAAFEWLFAHRIVKIFTVFCMIGFGIFSYWHRFNEVMTTNISGQVITVSDHIVAGVLLGFIGAIIGRFNEVCRLYPRLHALQIRKAFDRPWKSVVRL